MCKPLYFILACVFVFSYGANAIGRGTFQAKLRHCKLVCAIRDTQQKNTIQNCTVLKDHQDATVSKCVSRCLVKHEEDIKNSTECQCENGKCVGKSATKEPIPSSPSDPKFSTKPADPNSTPTAASSSTSAQTSSGSTASSGATPSSSPAPSSSASSSEPSTLRLLIENFENDEDDFPWL